ncbi:hypothetical protein COU01_04415 [Candidatus Falkowbacteria bacterium CG10_big_fil_rev_8_21_14_0_10_44_15]|uniref:Uncharacterized protein n=1 Tax=Candidatus Falkowbacteria bacterium CG10_big_fil_rev_8_21_14_0_10_44_15 TaxID=1974569 RepID=A0A2H0UYM6_9BACT|nr:MAG: hypothetical protein COU01_04415 [Candidatus Falkowbacteria bacterium CG10_big_fil_rev_8_21_14_0_10_44_15]
MKLQFTPVKGVFAGGAYPANAICGNKQNNAAIKTTTTVLPFPFPFMIFYLSWFDYYNLKQVIFL